MFSSSNNLIRSQARSGLNFSFNSQQPTQIIDVDDDDNNNSSSSSSSSSSETPTEIPHDNNGGYNGSFYVFTINNPLNNALCRDFTDSGLGKELQKRCGMKAGIWSYEVGESGTLHIQGYMQLEKKCKWSALKNKLKPLKAWCAPAKGTGEQNVEYVSHTGKHEGKKGLIQGPWSLGELVTGTKSSRSDLDDLANSIKKGATVKQLCDNHTTSMLKYFGNASKMTALMNKKTRSWMTELYIYTGVAGSGKSHSAMENGKKYLADNNITEEPYYLMFPNVKGQPLWWQDYEGQSVVIIDDFYGTGIDIDYFKRMIDKYPFTVNLKNGSAQFLARQVYITSNVGWKNWWGAELLSNVENAHAIERRITSVQEFHVRYNDRLGAAADVVAARDDIVGEEMGELRCTDLDEQWIRPLQDQSFYDALDDARFDNFDD